MAEENQSCSRLVRWWREFVLAPLAQANHDARVYLTSTAGQGTDRKVLTILVATVVLLTVQRYVCMTDEAVRTLRLLERLGLERVTTPALAYLGDVSTHPLERLTWWALGCVTIYFLVPALIVRLVFRDRLADYGFKLRGALAGAWVYLVLFALVGPLVLAASHGAHFQETYPFYQPSSGRLGPDFWRWELLYALQFIGLEFFFRGFLVHGLRQRFGAYAIPIMTVPYCMIHFYKPLLEAFASIPAGLVLGFLSLKTRSIALGAVLHISVALSMDFASLWRQGFFG
jgi:membrane protease YdiL (CAAX protease family)